MTENEKGDPKGRLAKPRKLVPEARVELARRETTVFETAASAIPPLGHISLHSITEARIRVYDKIAPRPALLSALVQLSSSFRESRDCGLFAGCALG